VFTARYGLYKYIQVIFTCFETLGMFLKMPVTHASFELLISTRVWSLVPVNPHQFRFACDGQQHVSCRVTLRTPAR